MKKLLLGTVAFIALAGSAAAADLAVKGPVVAAPACAQFGGFYLGGHVGWKYRENRWTDKNNFAQVAYGANNMFTGSESGSGWEAGVQTGYNFQWHCAVWGVVADWSWSNANVDNLYGQNWTPGANFNASHAYSSDEKWFGTLRTRSGVVVDNLLLYVTGGLAWAKFDRNHLYTGNNAGAIASQVFDSSATRLGFVVGVGTEWAWTQNWSINSEILYMGFEKDTATYACAGGSTAGFCGNVAFVRNGTPFQYDYKDSEWVARIGVNYRFGGYAPIVARY